jgi:hypothetical protein
VGTVDREAREQEDDDDYAAPDPYEPSPPRTWLVGHGFRNSSGS